MLMVKKTTTYSFCEFVNGRYLASNSKYITFLLAGMTHYERMSCMSFKFPMMWYLVYGEYPTPTRPTSNTYNTKHARFDRIFVADGGRRLRRLMRRCTRSNETLWEIPKGRRSYEDVTDVDTAIREFNEETGATCNDYKLVDRIVPFIESYTDMNVTYRNTYYYAIARDNWEPVSGYTNAKQYTEVADIRWVGWQDLEHMYNQPTARLMCRFGKITKKIGNSRRHHQRGVAAVKSYKPARYSFDVQSEDDNVLIEGNCSLPPGLVNGGEPIDSVLARVVSIPVA